MNTWNKNIGDMPVPSDTMVEIQYNYAIQKVAGRCTDYGPADTWNWDYVDDNGEFAVAYWREKV